MGRKLRILFCLWIFFRSEGDCRDGWKYVSFGTMSNTIWHWIVLQSYNTSFVLEKQTFRYCIRNACIYHHTTSGFLTNQKWFIMHIRIEKNTGIVLFKTRWIHIVQKTFAQNLHLRQLARNQGKVQNRPQNKDVVGPKLILQRQSELRRK